MELYLDELHLIPNKVIKHTKVLKNSNENSQYTFRFCY
jgi:hypothetical protein